MKSYIMCLALITFLGLHTLSSAQNTQQSATNKLILKISPNLECRLKVDGEDMGIIAADGIKKLYLSEGKYKIEAISTKNNFDVRSIKYTVTNQDLNAEDYYVMDLLKIQNIRIKAEQAKVEAERKEAEQKEREIYLANMENTKAARSGSFTDSRDGKTYKTIKIGTQTWMAENLAYKASSGCWAYNNNQSNVATYGYLYNWETAKNVCPVGWHLPSNAEWTILTDYLGGEDAAGGILKEAGTARWLSPNIGATNETGFTALPGGERFGDDRTFDDVGGYGNWWSSTEAYGYPSEANRWNLSDRSSDLSSGGYDQSDGYSVRCVKD